MAIYKFKELSPQFDESNFIAESADIIGNVLLSKNANIWYQCVARGDVNSIKIGEGTNIQDLSLLHVTEFHPLIVGNGVSVGHSVVLHGCTIEDNCLIGMGAKVLDGAVIGENSVVAAGSVVPPGKIYPKGSMIMGAPAKVVRELSVEEKSQYANHYKHYLNYAEEFKLEITKL